MSVYHTQRKFKGKSILLKQMTHQELFNQASELCKLQKRATPTYSLSTLPVHDTTEPQLIFDDPSCTRTPALIVDVMQDLAPVTSTSAVPGASPKYFSLNVTANLYVSLRNTLWESTHGGIFG